MWVNHREASERRRPFLGSTNAEVPSIEAIQQAVAEAFEVESTTCPAGGQHCRSTTIPNRYGKLATRRFICVAN